MPAEVLQQMIGKTVLISEKSKWYWQQSSRALHGKKVDLNGTHLWTRHYRHSKIKINISRHGRKLAFQLRSEEWLTSTVVIKIRYSNFDTETKQCRIPYTSADHTLTSAWNIRQAIPTSHAIASDWYSI
jgi:DNA polymerase-4